MAELRQALIGHFVVCAEDSDTNMLLTVAGQGDDLRVVMEGTTGGKRFAVEKRVEFDHAAWEALAKSLRGQEAFELPVTAAVGGHEVERTVRFRATRSLAAPRSLVLDSDASLRVTAIEFRCNPFFLAALIVAAIAVVAVSTVAVTAMVTCSDVDMKAGGAAASVRCGSKFTEASEPIPYYPDEGPGGEHGI